MVCNAPFLAPTESKFIENAGITPKEFVHPGDQLVTVCPSWEWKSGFNDNVAKSELPQEKQYLYSKVSCQKRVKDLIKGGETREKPRKERNYLPYLTSLTGTVNRLVMDGLSLKEL